MGITITGKTSICALIGDPVEHTISPAIQNAAFQARGLDYAYIPLRVEPADLERAVAGARALHFRGLNVTIPHKVAVMHFLDEVDETAARLGAVNTVVNNEGYLKGYNTDAGGFYRALTVAGVNPAGRRVTVLGAGGAARAIAFILADRGAALTILNRDPRRAESLAETLMGLFRCEVAAGGLEADKIARCLKESEIVVNTTSVGMTPQAGLSPLPSGLIRPDQVVFDIIYNPLQTRLLAEAEAAGALTIGGLEMLIQQGAAAFELWTGQTAPVEEMRRAARSAIEG